MVGVVSGGRGAGSDLRAVCATNMFWHKRTVIPTTRSHDFWRPRAAASGVTLPHLREEGSHSSLQRTPPPLLTSTSFPFFWRRPADRQIPVPYITARLLAALAHLPARRKRAREQESEHTASLKEGECRSSSTDAAKSATLVTRAGGRARTGACAEDGGCASSSTSSASSSAPSSTGWTCVHHHGGAASRARTPL